MENNRKNPKEDPFIKNQYYPGKLLHASDFVREQEYGSSKLAFLNRKFHGSGIIDGLNVRAGQGGDWYVTAGSAIDPEGRILVLPEDTKIDFERLGGLPEEGVSFVLGIRYAERVLERERSIFEGKETYQAARVAESVAFGAYSLNEWRRLRAKAGRYEENLTQERVLYENGEVRLLLRLPKLVPSDSMFRARIQVVAVDGGAVRIGWRGTGKLQGAFFAESGSDSLILEKNQMVFSGTMQEGWEICTEEGRNLPVLFELSQLELLREGSVFARVETVQVSVETAASYQLAAEKYLWDEGTVGGAGDIGIPQEDDRKESGWDGAVPDGRDVFMGSGQEDARSENPQDGSKRSETGQIGFPWLPLACFQMAVHLDGKRHFAVMPDRAVRFGTVHPQEEEILRRAAQENGIVDIRWRSLLKDSRPFTPPPVPAVPQPALPLPAPQPAPPAQAPVLPAQFAEAFGEEWGKHICRGVAVIPVPKHYRKGQVLLSEEISYGFAGEEVSIWCGRLRETTGHVYWERDKKSFFVIQGDEGLFPEQKGGWEIEKQALRQNVAEGSFQIALTLSKGSRRNRIREVAVSWIVVKSI